MGKHADSTCALLGSETDTGEERRVAPSRATPHKAPETGPILDDSCESSKRHRWLRSHKTLLYAVKRDGSVEQVLGADSPELEAV